MKDTLTHIHGPWFDQTTGQPATIRVTGRVKHLAKEGYVAGDITVEFEGPPSLLPPDGFITNAMTSLHLECRLAAAEMNREGEGHG